MDSIKHNLSLVHQSIADACSTHNCEKISVNLLCVSKTKPEDLIKQAYACGERHFGESYAVEASEKIQSLKAQGYNDIVWHFIGPIQKNKTKLIAANFDIVESVDRDIVAKRLNDQRPDELPALDVLVQVNISHEDQKSGCEESDIDDIISCINSLPKLRLRGFMGIATDTTDKALIESEFAHLKALFDKYKTKFDNFDILSMGMTHDLDLAIKHGSNEVRIGTAIFGAREYKNKVTMNEQKIAFIGGGNMATCIFESIVKSFDVKNITVSGPHLEKLEKFKAKGASITTDNVAAIKDAQVIFLGVKPQILTSVLQELSASGVNLSDKLFVSMAAGFKLSSISNLLKTHKLIRIMPNTPAKLGLGVIAVTYDTEVTDEQKTLCKTMLSHMGTCIEGDENNLNVIGAVCGCGPAFVYRFMEALITEAIRHGISEQDARKMVEQTVFGSVNMVIQNQDTTIAALREAVTSKGGTTFAGLTKMTEGNFEKIMENTIQASLDRTYEFEKMF
ncbi:MAG: YggS family pyridoxal phosphate-dependent enzyme [Succinivibrio sp.]|nr:YggS family pyridoxal phosphate-dependent enzyme [Succinivibrio sp.]MCI6449914.1 YggS family pyridoxal phosphate-dependent enzyme [Succinivibrio sp.]MDD7286920.1 YggS family pyridoxal phosphate-dependent enzyme [Succinivibrio sp.]MDY5904745.1 YggS family pyridoxal phosphate-dependent enzyme [Succinivibrio sp.]